MLWLLAACGPNARLTESGSGGTESGGSGAGATESDDGSDSTGAPAGIVGVWVGYADGLWLPSGSDRVELRITDVDGSGQVIATMLLGEPGEPLPPPTDPDVGYPEGWTPVTGAASELFERFDYTVTGTFDASLDRFEASFSSFEVFAQWCALQTPILWGEDTYGCLPNCGSSSGPSGCQLMDCDQGGPVDCVKLELCGFAPICMCEADGCTIPEGALPLDLHLAGDSLEGPVDRLGTVFLSRQ